MLRQPEQRSRQVYTQALGFEDPAFPNHVCLLNKSLYGLKQAPRAWFQRFSTFVQTIGFTPSRSDYSLFVFNSDGKVAYLLLYVDDIVLTASYQNFLNHVISLLQHEFAMTDLGACEILVALQVMGGDLVGFTD